MKNVTPVGYWSQYSQANQKKEDAVENDVKSAFEMAMIIAAGMFTGFWMIVIAFTF